MGIASRPRRVQRHGFVRKRHPLNATRHGSVTLTITSATPGGIGQRYNVFMAEVVVLDYHRPRVRLLGWLLKDSGMRVEEVASVSRAITLARRPDCRCVIVNSIESKPAICRLMKRLRAGRPRGRLAFITPRRPFGALPPPCVPIDVTLDSEELVNQVRSLVAGPEPATRLESS